MGGRLALCSALERPPWASLQATENLEKYSIDGGRTVKSPMWPVQRKGLDSSSSCSVVDLS